MKEQFEKLILRLISEIKDLLTIKLVLVVDTLDECDNKGHITLALHLLLAQTQKLKSLNIRIFLTSRPELPIRLEFNKVPDVYQDLLLHEISKPIIIHDISVFLQSKFTKI